MKKTLQKHKDLIKLAETQQELGKPIRYSVGFLSTKTPDTEEADVYEVSITNDPVSVFPIFTSAPFAMANVNKKKPSFRWSGPSNSIRSGNTVSVHIQTVPNSCITQFIL